MVHQSDSFPEQKPALLTFWRREEIYGVQGCRYHCRWRSGGINEGTGAIDQPFDKRACSADVSAAGTQGLAQRAHLNINFLAYIFCRSETAAIWTNHPNSVRFIEQEQCPESFF